MKRKPEEVVNAIGALAEMCRLFYSHLVKLGFTRGEALELTKGYIIATMTPTTNNNDTEEY